MTSVARVSALYRMCVRILRCFVGQHVGKGNSDICARQINAREIGLSSNLANERSQMAQCCMVVARWSIQCCIYIREDQVTATAFVLFANN